MHQQGGLAVEINHCGFGKQADSGAVGKALAEQKIAVAMNKEQLNAPLLAGFEGSGDFAGAAIGCIVAHPHIKEVAQYIKVIASVKGAGQKALQCCGQGWPSTA